MSRWIKNIIRKIKLFFERPKSSGMTSCTIMPDIEKYQVIIVDSKSELKEELHFDK